MGQAARTGPAWIACLAFSMAAPAADRPSSKALSMTPAIACESIAGYEDYVPLGEAAVTADDKLLLYYRPLHFRVEKVGAEYQGHLTVDGQVRRKGEKAVLRKKVDVIKYEPRKKTPEMYLFLNHSVSVKGLPPGDYELEITLHDRIAPGSTATQVVPFRIKPASKDAEPKPAP